MDCRNLRRLQEVEEMSKIINITDKLRTDKPVIQIGDKEYSVNDGLDTVMKFEELASAGSTENMIKAIEVALGEKAAKELKPQGMSVSNFQVLVIAIMAAVQGVAYEEAASRFRKAEQKL